MSKINRKDMAERVAAAGSAPSSDRFASAAAVLAAMPTGFHPRAEVSSEIIEVRKATADVLVEVPLCEIDPNPYNARKFYSEDAIQTMAISLASDGQEIPGTATIREGRYVLAAGHYRLKALKLAGLPTMKLIVKPSLSDQDLYRISFLENDQRAGQSALDNAFVWRELLSKGLYSSELELAEAVKKSPPTVNKTLRLLHLDADIVTLISNNPDAFKMSVLYELVLLQEVAGPAIALKAALELEAGEASRRSLQILRARHESNSKGRVQVNSRQNFKLLSSDGQRIGSIKEWESGRVALDVVIEDPNARAEFFQEIRRRFQSK